jgi:hypothetical protein
MLNMDLILHILRALSGGLLTLAIVAVIVFPAVYISEEFLNK